MEVVVTLDEDEYWEWFEEIDDFKHDLRTGWSSWPKDTSEESVYDAEMFVLAVAETRNVYGFLGGHDVMRSRGPGRRIRVRYWDA